MPNVSREGPGFLLSKKHDGEKEALDLQRQAEKTSRRWVLIFWIPVLLLVVVSVVTALAFSCEDAPQNPSGEESGVLKLGEALLTGKEAELSAGEVSALLYPLLQEKLPRELRLTGFSLEAPGENCLYARVLVEKFGREFLLSFRWALFPGTNTLRLEEAKLGKLPIPSSWAYECIKEALTEEYCPGNQTLTLPESFSFSLWEGTEPVTLHWSEIRAKEGNLYISLWAQVDWLSLLP